MAGNVLITLSKDYSNLPMPFVIGVQLDERGRLNVGYVRKLIKDMDNLKTVKVGQIVGILRDGSRVADICSGCVFADNNGLNYSVDDVVYRDLKELEDFEHFLLTGPERLHIIASDGTGCLFKKKW